MLDGNTEAQHVRQGSPISRLLLVPTWLQVRGQGQPWRGAFLTLWLTVPPRGTVFSHLDGEAVWLGWAKTCHLLGRSGHCHSQV